MWGGRKTCERAGQRRVRSGRGVAWAWLSGEKGSKAPHPLARAPAQTSCPPSSGARALKPCLAFFHFISSHFASQSLASSPRVFASAESHAAPAGCLPTSPPPCDPAGPAAWPAPGPLDASAPAPRVEHRELGPTRWGGAGGTRRVGACGRGGEDAAAARVGGFGGRAKVGGLRGPVGGRGGVAVRVPGLGLRRREAGTWRSARASEGRAFVVGTFYGREARGAELSLPTSEYLPPSIAL